MPDEMSQSEQAAFAAMREEQAPPAEPEQAEPEQEGAEPPPEGDEGEVPAEGEEQPQRAERPRFVPHAAFNEERSRRQQLEAENRHLAEERARFDERLRIIQEMNRPQPEPAPDVTVDPIGRIINVDERLARLEQTWQQGSQQWNEQQQEAARVRQVVEAAKYDADRVQAQVPDYPQAFQYWMESRAGEMRTYGMHPARIAAELEKEQFDISQGAFQRGVSPAETLYAIAKQRGFKGGNGRAGNGQDGAAERIQRVATGQERNQTLSGTGGGATPTAMTGERLARMSDDEFYAWTTANRSAADRLLGKEPKRGRG